MKEVMDNLDSNNKTIKNTGFIGFKSILSDMVFGGGEETFFSPS